METKQKWSETTNYTTTKLPNLRMSKRLWIRSGRPQQTQWRQDPAKENVYEYRFNLQAQLDKIARG